MSRKRQKITMPADLILDNRIFANAKIVYAVLETLPANKVKAGSPSSPPSTPASRSITVTHGAIVERSGLTYHMVVKSLNRLEAAGWIFQQRNPGSANTYFFTTPVG